MHRILLVDNDTEVANVLRTFLDRSGFAVTLASNGQKGIDALCAARDRGEPFDLLILDLQMPGMSGLEVVTRLERDRVAPPVLVVSGFVDDADRSRLSTSPIVYAVLNKPFDLFRLRAASDDAILAAQTSRGATGELPWPQNDGTELPFSR